MGQISDNATIKGLQVQLSKLEGELSSIQMELVNKTKDLETKKKSIQVLKKKIDEIMPSDNPSVSDHAIVRYLERVKGLNIKDIEKEILTDDVIKLINVLGISGTYPSKGGFSIVMKNNNVVTIKK